jgi:hypothetical protein
MCLDFRRYENLFPKKKKKKFKMVLCQRLQKYVPFSLKNGKCMYQHKTVLCQGCQQNHSFIIEKTCEILASELPSKKQVGSGPSQPLAKPSKTFQKT